RLSEDVVRHETKDHVRDLTVFANRHACAAVLGRQKVSPLAGEAEIRVANPRHHSLRRNVFDEFVVDGPVLPFFTKVDWLTWLRIDFNPFDVRTPFRRG